MGSAIDRGTEPRAAWCRTKSMPVTGGRTGGRVADITLDETESLGEVRLQSKNPLNVRPLPRQEIVQPNYAVSGSKQVFEQVRPYEARYARDQPRPRAPREDLTEVIAERQPARVWRRHCNHYAVIEVTAQQIARLNDEDHRTVQQRKRRRIGGRTVSET